VFGVWGELSLQCPLAGGLGEALEVVPTARSTSNLHVCTFTRRPIHPGYLPLFWASTLLRYHPYRIWYIVGTRAHYLKPAMSHDSDSPIRVVVTPSQSSCFAGETMSITITFTNTNTNTAQQTSSRAVSHTHKRSAHSISAVPLAQPPTSPRSPRTVLPVIVTRKPGESDVIERKGLIGRSDGNSRRMRTSNRSLSLDMSFKGNGEVSPLRENSSSPPKTPIHVQRALGTATSTSNHRCLWK